MDFHSQFFPWSGPAGYHKGILGVRGIHLLPVPTILLVEHKKSLKPHNPFSPKLLTQKQLQISNHPSIINPKQF